MAVTIGHRIPNDIDYVVISNIVEVVAMVVDVREGIVRQVYPVSVVSIDIEPLVLDRVEGIVVEIDIVWTI
jgi:hypothetical protein